jgi:hypothetical protein
MILANIKKSMVEVKPINKTYNSFRGKQVYLQKKNHRYGICGGHMGEPCGMLITLEYMKKDFCANR